MGNVGISALSPGVSNSSIVSGIAASNVIRAVRVKSIVLNEEHPLFTKVGEWNGLGTIEYQEVDNPQVFDVYPVAKPLNSNVKQFPLINEIVYLLFLPDTNIGDFTSNGTAYYINTVSLWNHPHHNGYPADPNILPDSQQKDYIQTQAGSVRRVTDQSTEINLGRTFVERSNIHPILPFEGDFIQEGRWGNSIRFGSTVNKTAEYSRQIPINLIEQSIQNFNSGDTTLSSDFLTKLQYINAQVKEFTTFYPNYRISIYLKASESQVPNPSPYQKGDLSKLRLQNLKNVLINYSDLNVNLVETTLIGTTPYIQGESNPRDPQYVKEQYVSLIAYVQTTIEEQYPESTNSLTPWSEVGTNGDPITIIRNGQGEQSGEGWVPIVEDINNDDSSIYLTSTQQIPLIPSSSNYSSYSTPPENIECYAGKQVIINSGRLVFNSTEDHILFSSTKSVGLNSLESVNIDSPKTVIQSNNIYLGDKDATEPILLGNQTTILLNQLIVNLKAFTEICSVLVSTPPGTPLGPLNAVSKQFATVLGTLQQNLEDVKSKQNFTK